MADLRVEHTFNCSVDTFWDKLFFDPEYNERLFKQTLRFHDWTEVHRADKGDRIERIVEVMPRLGDLPGPLKKLVGDGVKYREEGVFEKTPRLYRMKIVPNKLADKLALNGEIQVVADGEARCKRVFLFHAEAKVFGVGGLLEKRLLEDTQKSQIISAEFTNRYIAEKGL
jgi:hypothetical protein